MERQWKMGSKGRALVSKSCGIFIYSRSQEHCFFLKNGRSAEWRCKNISEREALKTPERAPAIEKGIKIMHAQNTVLAYQIQRHADTSRQKKLSDKTPPSLNTQTHPGLQRNQDIQRDRATNTHTDKFSERLTTKTNT